MLDEAVAGLKDRIGGARAALLVGADGMIVAGSGEDRGASWELVVASYADVLRRTAAANREAEIAEPVELIVTSASTTLVFRAVTPEYGLLMVLDPDGSLGRARFELRKAAHAILPEL